MKHLLPTSDLQIINIIPRIYSRDVIMKLRDDSTNETVTIVSVGARYKNYIKITTVFDLKEGHFYDLKVYDGQGEITDSNIIYRDKIFCTAQSTNQTSGNQYTINKNEYVSKSANNDFIIL
tara:strand:- start:3028 stop:3390 length:363 start_codon:yes stop_codon:yes gene_type:complete